MMRRMMFVALAAALAVAGCAHREKTAPCGPLSLSWWFSACGPAVPIND
jgi:nitrous oxide reductase accessory protein NosL